MKGETGLDSSALNVCHGVGRPPASAKGHSCSVRWGEKRAAEPRTATSLRTFKQITDGSNHSLFMQLLRVGGRIKDELGAVI